RGDVSAIARDRRMDNVPQSFATTLCASSRPAEGPSRTARSSGREHRGLDLRGAGHFRGAFLMERDSKRSTCVGWPREYQGTDKPRLNYLCPACGRRRRNAPSGSRQPRLALSVISLFSRREIGQPALASCAAFSNAAALASGTLRDAVEAMYGLASGTF